MKKLISAVIAVIACIALCAAVWPRSAKVGDLPADPDKTAENAEIMVRSEGTPQTLFSAVTPAPEVETVAEIEPKETEITAEKEIETAQPAESPPCAVSKSAPASSEPKSGDRTIIDGKPHIWIPGFGWIEDEGGGSIGTTVGNPGDELAGNKVGIMGGGTTVHGKGDINKQVGIMGGGTVAEDMYESGNKIGIMGGAECPSDEPVAQPSEQPELTGDVIYTEFQPPVTKDSTPPPYKPNGEPINP